MLFVFLCTNAFFWFLMGLLFVVCVVQEARYSTKTFAAVGIALAVASFLLAAVSIVYAATL